MLLEAVSAKAARDLTGSRWPGRVGVGGGTPPHRPECTSLGVTRRCNEVFMARPEPPRGPAGARRRGMAWLTARTRT